MRGRAIFSFAAIAIYARIYTAGNSMIEAALPAMGGKGDVSEVLERITTRGE